MDLDNHDIDQRFVRQPIPPETPPKRYDNRKKSKRKKHLLPKIIIFIVIIILIISGVVGYFWWNSKSASKQNKSTTTSNSKTSSDTSNAVDDPKLIKVPEQQKINIAGAISLKNYDFLEQYMADTVKVVIADTNTTNTDTPAQSVVDLKHIEGSDKTWSFELSLDTLKSYRKGKYSAYFKEGNLIGKSSNNYFATFSFNTDNKIDTIFMSTTSNGLSK